MSSSSSSSSDSSSSSAPKPQSTPAQADSLQAILKKNIRENTRKKYNGHQKVIWKWLRTQPAMVAHLNDDGSLTKRGCEIWASDPAWFYSFVSSLTLETPEGGEEVGEDDDGDIIAIKGLATLEGYRSAIHKYLDEMGAPRNQVYKQGIKLMFNGLGRNDADSNQGKCVIIKNDLFNDLVQMLNDNGKKNYFF